MKNSNKLLLLSVTFMLLVGACATKTVYVEKQPPQKKIEMRTDRPGVDYSWVEGHWEWSVVTDKYIWKKGYWLKNRKTKVWVPGHWKKTPRGWLWIHGYWK